MRYWKTTSTIRYLARRQVARFRGMRRIITSRGAGCRWKKFDFVYSLDWRTGFPFSVVNQQQQLVGALNSRRFPDYFTLNTHLERRFTLFSYILALRAGFNNVTNRQNPTVVNNNLDSPQFLTFGGTEHRVFTGRIRFIGRK